MRRSVSFGKGLLGCSVTEDEALFMVLSSGGKIEYTRRDARGGGFIVANYKSDPHTGINLDRIRAKGIQIHGGFKHLK